MALGGAPPLCSAPERNTKSPKNDEDSHGVCWPRVSRYTALSVRLDVSSKDRFGVLIACERCFVLGLLRAQPARATPPGDVENETNSRGPLSIRDRPRTPVALASGLSRQASSTTMLSSLRAPVIASTTSAAATDWAVSSALSAKRSPIGMM